MHHAAARHLDPAHTLLVGVSGDSGSGKSTFVGGLNATFHSIRTLCTDDYRRYTRAQRKGLGINPAHPDCNYMDILRQHLALLASGQAVLKPVYDHARGTTSHVEYVEPAGVVVVEGMLALRDAGVRRLLNVSVYLEPCEHRRQRAKLERDTSDRGYTRGDMPAELAPSDLGDQRRHADLVVREDELLLRAHLPRAAESLPLEVAIDRDGLRPIDRIRLAPGIAQRDVLHAIDTCAASLGAAHPNLGWTRDGRVPLLALAQLLTLALATES